MGHYFKDRQYTICAYFRRLKSIHPDMLIGQPTYGYPQVGLIHRGFGKATCKLCMKERLSILRNLRTKQDSIINSRTELYGACRHKTKFHRYENSIFISADESHQGSKRIDETSNGNLTSQCIKCTSSISTYSESENSGRELEFSPSTGSSLNTPGSTSSRDTYNNFMKFDV